MENYKSGFIAVMGRPNVGKSTLLNSLLQQKIAAVSPKPQTTRFQQFGILTLDRAQLIFIDTAGLHHPHHTLGEYMNEGAKNALKDADMGLLIVDGSDIPPRDEDRLILEILQEIEPTPAMVIAMNKIDKLTSQQVEEHANAYQGLIPDAELIPISATRGDHLDQLTDTLLKYLPEGPPLFPEDQVTDLFERDIAADMIRAAAMIHLKHEVPHAVAVRIDEFKERNDHGAYISATLFAERESQKAIVIGKNGSMIKRIGITARKEIEEMSGRKVYLKLRVKVRKNWRNDENTLNLLGFKK
ncbi:MAG: GTPase Era [Anaerolineales bacterium]